MNLFILNIDKEDTLEGKNWRIFIFRSPTPISHAISTALKPVLFFAKKKVDCDTLFFGYIS